MSLEFIRKEPRPMTRDEALKIAADVPEELLPTACELVEALIKGQSPLESDHPVLPSKD